MKKFKDFLYEDVDLLKKLQALLERFMSAQEMVHSTHKQTFWFQPELMVVGALYSIWYSNIIKSDNWDPGPTTIKIENFGVTKVHDNPYVYFSCDIFWDDYEAGTNTYNCQMVYKCALPTDRSLFLNGQAFYNFLVEEPNHAISISDPISSPQFTLEEYSPALLDRIKPKLRASFERCAPAFINEWRQTKSRGWLNFADVDYVVSSSAKIRTTVTNTQICEVTFIF